MQGIEIEYREDILKKRKRKKLIRRCIGYLILLLIILLAILLVILFICGILYVNEHLFAPPSEEQNIAVNIDTEPPPDNEAVQYQPETPSVPIKSVVTIDAGHGGIQPGCEFDGVLEKDITLSVALMLQEELESRGVTVIMTRDGDEDVGLEDRCKIANDADADLFVSIHCNSYIDDVSIDGFEGYYYKNEEGKRLAELILQSAQSHSIKTRHVNEENYLVLRDTNMPSVLLEIGFLSNESERERLQTEEYQAEIAKSIAEGIVEMITEPNS